MEKIVSRLAPTPSGFLHLGNGLNFVLTWVLTRRAGGKLWLRIDDLDAPRMREEYLEDIFRTLEWLGLDYDYGPSGPEDHRKNYSQQNRRDEYQAALEQIAAQGGNVFGCVCSRSQIQTSGGQYIGTCREAAIPLFQPETAWRLLTPPKTLIHWDDFFQGNKSVNLYERMRDFVIRRKDGIPAYQIVSVWEDIHNGINLIVRGEDLADSTAAQLFLARFFPENAFAHTRFYHHALLTDNEGRKLSKSAGSFSLKEMRSAGKGPSAVFREAAKILGHAEREFTTAAEFLF
ncbi:MAG: glutamate--tRNA ligase family protein [Bacteroidia bacterium]|nr:glutamate--tRNA ligase family protein [Bacteroidia bacterium]